MPENNEVEDNSTVREGPDAADENGDAQVGPTDGNEPVSVFLESANDSSAFQPVESDEASADGGDSIQNAPKDIRVTEEGGKEEMFVDCPDEIENSETQLITEENDEGHATQVKELDNGTQVRDLKAEIEHLQNMLENTAAERDSFAQKYQSVSNEHAQSEGTLNELHAMLSMKDQEIESLGDKVTELSRSHELSQAQLEQYLHVEDFANRILASLTAAVYQEERLEESITEKISHAEKAISLLIEQHNLFRSEIDQLKGSLEEVVPDINMQDEAGVFVTAQNTISELRRKAVDMDQKLAQSVDENKLLLAELDRHKAMVGNTNAEISKLNAELEQEKTKFVNTKEKLSLAVTKGKALVQQRDSLKQSLAEKTSQLDKCLAELKEKSNALEAAEQNKDLMVKSESLVASLHEALTEKDTILHKCGEILSESAETEEYQAMDIIEKVRWLTDERNALRGISLEFHKLTDTLLSYDFPESVKSSGLDAHVGWLLDSLNIAKQEAAKLHDEISRMKETARNEIDQLSATLLAVTQEKDYLLAELDDLRSKYEVIVEKEYQASKEKDMIVRILGEASGIAYNDPEEDYQPLSDVATITHKCIAKIKDDASAVSDFSLSEVENFEKLQIHLYLRDAELMLYCQIFEEEMLDRAEVSSLSNELVVLRNELSLLKNEKDSVQKDLERSEEKAALLREKLSMAVKKGKGLVQERENLKKTLDAKDSEIKNLKLELQQQLSACNDSRDQIDKLSADIERIPKLEADIMAIKEQKDQTEKFLVESNNILKRVFELIDGIVIPDDLVFDDPLEKVKWVVGFFSECQTAKMASEQELWKAKDEASSLAGRLDELQLTEKSLQDALLVAESKISELLEENKQLDVSKSSVEQELQKVIEEASSQTNKFAEVRASQKSLEDALQMAENKISMLINEKQDALTWKASAEKELQKVKEEMSVQDNKIAEADNVLQSLEDALSQAQKNIALLSEDNSNAITHKTDMEKEIQKLKEEVDSHVVRLANSDASIKRLEDALSNAEGKFSDLLIEKKISDEEISALNIKLNACMQESAGTRGSLESTSMELSGHLTSLRRLVKDENLVSVLHQSFEKKISGLNNMNLLLKEMRDNILKLDTPQNDPAIEVETSPSILSPVGLDNVLNLAMTNGEENVADGDSIVFHIGKSVEGLQLRDKGLADKVEHFSIFMDDLIASLLTDLQVINHRFITALELIKSLKKKDNDMELDRQALQNTIFILENNVGSLMPACTDATKELESEVQQSLSELRSYSEMGRLEESLSMELGADGVVDSLGHDQQVSESNEYEKAAEELLFAAIQSRNLNRHFRNVVSKMITTIEFMQKELKESKETSEEVLGERDLYQNKITKLECDLETSENLCKELSDRLEEYQEKENNLKEREAELLSLYATSLQKVEEAEGSFLSASAMKSLFDKLTRIEAPDSECEARELQLHDSADVTKLFYVVDSYTGLNHQISLLTQEKENLHSALEKQASEIKNLKEEVEEHYKDKNDFEKTKNELLYLATGLENMINMLGGDESLEGKKPASLRGILQVLENLVLASKMGSENWRTEAEELGIKLVGTQKLVDDLSSKVRLLENSIPTRVSSPETVNERGIFESSSSAPQSEISEIQDKGPVGSNKAIPPIQSAAHPRTLRKGSNDHLAISIDSDSERLLNEGKDDDKGHIFKSLNTSGLIPRQGKIAADRVDGMWVSGSRALMSHPRARIGLIAYSLFLHLWLLGTIL